MPTAELYPQFSDFWDLYDKKVGRDVAMKEWNKTSQADRETAMSHVPEYVLSTPNKKYRLNASTYLHQKRYYDEIITNNNGANRVFDRNEVEAGIREHFNRK